MVRQNADWIGPFESDEGVPQTIRDNKGRNQYFMIPLLLGLIGFFFQFNRDPKRFAATLMLFILTGLALVIYLNSPPIEPRERDYIYVGSYYVFAFWIGFSVLAIGNALLKRKAAKSVVIASIAIGMLAPFILAKENWDDHDRSGRYLSVDSARNFLASCAPNAILFTGGDNDTFPLWYIQEVEGFRTDVRVVVMSYYETDWYIDQTATKMNDSEAFPYSLDIENYREGTNDALYVSEMAQFVGQAVDLNDYLDVIKRDVEAFKIPMQSGDKIMRVPTDILKLEVDTAKVLDMGIIPNNLREYITPTMFFALKKDRNGELQSRILTKGQMMLLDLIANNNWERPIYFNYTSVSGLSFNLDPYLVQEGMAYRLLPIMNPNGRGRDQVNTDLMYKNITEEMRFRGLDDPGANLNEDYRGFIQNHRSMFTTLSDALIQEGDTARAKEMLDMGMEKMPAEAAPYDVSSIGFVQGYFDIGEPDKATKMAMEMASQFDSEVSYLQDRYRYNRELSIKLQGLRYLEALLSSNGKLEEAEKVRLMLEAQNIRSEADRRNF